MQRGDRIGRFEIVGRVASGGMGTVFRARDLKERRDVALKILANDGDAARFDREAAILATIAHESVVRYVAHGSVPDGLRYLAMEWVDGESLAERLARTGVDRRRAIAIGVQLARALGALHGAGIVHRDVKPANVMLAGDRVKLVDFGIARPIGSRTNLTRTGTLVGTAGYMAPEQARGDSTIDGRTDLFALGCILFECIAGQPAFRGESMVALRAKVLLHDPPRLAQLVPDVPRALDALVASLLARAIADRPADASSVEAAVAPLAEIAGAARVVETTGAETVTSSPPALRCAVLVVLDDVEASIELAELGTVLPFDGGMVIPCAPAAAIRIARACERLGLVAIGSGPSPGEAIDRAAQLLDAVELAELAAGRPAQGAWVDRATAAVVGVPAAGERIRIT